MVAARLPQILAAVVLALLAAPSFDVRPVSAGAEVEKQTGFGATAEFVSRSADGCIVTTVPIYLVTEELRRPGEVPSGPFMDIDNLTVVDGCTGEFLLSAYFSSRDFAFDVGPRLASATLLASGTVASCYGPLCPSSTFALDIALSWTASAPLVRNQSHFHAVIDGDVRNATENGAKRAAVASGTVTSGSTNYTPNSTADAELSFRTFTWVNAPAGS